jgi:rSAM-associated Gly-rich repeat protein
MSLRQRYIKVISQIMPAGAIGVSLLLSAAAPGEAAQHPVGSQLSTADRFTVAERLAAIRQQVSDVAPDAVTSRPGELLLAWGNWWRNGGCRNGGWGNWRNGSHNGGWHYW